VPLSTFLANRELLRAKVKQKNFEKNIFDAKFLED
jgi:hypothetical protein